MAAFSTGSMDQPVDLTGDVQRLLEDLARRRPDRRQLVAGECMPVVDVFETEKTVEIVLDLPGVAADAVRILFKAGVLLIVGEKDRPDVSKRGPASFHLVERDFGRFARAVRINAAIDGAQAKARLANGELRVVLPRIAERRGAGLLVPIDGPTGQQATGPTAAKPSGE
jgi:HSP20 family protein